MNSDEACTALNLANKYRQNHSASKYSIPIKSLCKGAKDYAKKLADESLAAGKVLLYHSCEFCIFRFFTVLSYF